MSRHRNVRSMNYHDEYDGYDDVYGHSVEEGDFCVSPSTAHYLSSRHDQPSLLGAFMTPDKIEEEENSDEEGTDTLTDSREYKRPTLNETDEAKLNSCLEELRNIIGESTPEHIMVEAVISCDFDFEKALNAILTQQENPKPQRERKPRKIRDAESDSRSPSPPETIPFGIAPRSSPLRDLNRKQSKTFNIEQVGSIGISGRDKDGSGKGSSETTNKNAQPKDGLKTKVKNPTLPSGFSLALLAKENQEKENVDQNLRDVLSISPVMYQTERDSNNIKPIGMISPTEGTELHSSPNVKLTKGLVQNAESGQNDVTESEAPTKSIPVTCDVPTPGAGLSLAALAQQHTERNSPIGNQSFLGSPSLSHFAKLHMESRADPGDLEAKNVSVVNRAKAAGGIPLPVVGFSLGDLARQHAEKSSSEITPTYEGSPSLRELSRQHKVDISSDLKATGERNIVNTMSGPHHKFSGEKGRTAIKISGNQKMGFVEKTQNSLHLEGTPSLSSLAQLHEKSMVDEDEAAPVLPLPMPSSNVPSALDHQNVLPGLRLPLAALAKQNAQSATPGSINRSGPELKATSHNAPSEEGPFLQNAVHDSPHTDCSKTNPALLAKQQKLAAQSYPMVKIICSNTPLSGETDMHGLEIPNRTEEIPRATDQIGTKHATTPPGFKAIDLAELASRHSASYNQTQSQDTTKLPGKIDTLTSLSVAKVKTTRASIFGHALCVPAKECFSVPPIKTSVSQSKFSYHRQISHDATVNCHAFKTIVPFDFSTQSPDDYVRKRQRGAFTRTGERMVQADPIQPVFILNEPPKPRKASPKPEEQIAAEPLAKMTIASTKKVSSGFNPSAGDKEKNVPFVDDMADIGGATPKLRDRQAAEKSEKTTPGSEAATPKKERDTFETSGATASVQRSPQAPRSTPRSTAGKEKVLKEYSKRSEGAKTCINMVVIGHVDAGKSTLMGHLLVQLGFVNKKTIHKFEQESKKIGKSSFAFAWVLDETEEERSRGVTMDVAQTRFETESKVVTLLDAPGHKDFIPNMITGAAQADVAVLVVNATRGEFETGFEAGGQTREHAMLIRSLGVSQLCVAINKMDTVDWGRDRYEEITKKLGSFLKTAGFREADVSYIPCSGLSGENLTKPTSQPLLSAWYKGPTLVQQIDQFKPPERLVQKSLRMVISDVFKGMGAGFSVSGNIQAGAVQPGDKLLIMPQAETANVKSVTIDDLPVPYGFAGDNVVVTVTGVDQQNLTIGSLMCDPANPVQVTSRLRARVVIFNIEVPLTQGFPVVFHYGAASEPAHIRKLVSQLHKSTGEVVRKKPRCLTKNSNAVIEVELSRPICIELYKDYRDLGRFMLRYSGATIAAGLVTEILKPKGGKTE